MVKVQIVFPFKGVTSPKHSLTDQHNFPTFYWSRCKTAPPLQLQLQLGCNKAPWGFSALRSLWRPGDLEDGGRPRAWDKGWAFSLEASHKFPPALSVLFEKSDLASIKFPCIFEVTCYSFTSLSPQSSFQVSIFCCPLSCAPVLIHLQ